MKSHREYIGNELPIPERRIHRRRALEDLRDTLQFDRQPSAVDEDRTVEIVRLLVA